MRSYALDALRALAILGMSLSGQLPWGTLPAFMYHAQTPPPDMKHVATVAGITWVDLVFPFFLFSMGVALPIFLGKKLEKGEGVILGIFKRFALLLGLAIIHQHIQPTVLAAPPTMHENWLAIGYFLAAVLLFRRVPKAPPWVHWAAWAVGGGVLAFALLNWKYPDGSGFNPERQNIILAVLAHVSLTGSLVWLATRKSWKVRLGVIAFLLVLVLFKEVPGPIKTYLWNWTPLPWLYRFEFQKYLILVLIGTLVGERLLARKEEDTVPIWIAPLTFVFVAVSLTLLLTHNLYVLYALYVLSLGAGLLVLPRGSWVWGLWLGGAVCLLVGLLLLPLHGGIKKDPSTPSYYFFPTGLAIWSLLALQAIRDKWVKPDRPGFLALAGANPILGYIAISNLIWPLLRLTGIWAWLGDQGWGPWGMAAFAGLQTLAVGVVCAVCTKLGIFARS